MTTDFDYSIQKNGVLFECNLILIRPLEKSLALWLVEPMSYHFWISAVFQDPRVVEEALWGTVGYLSMATVFSRVLCILSSGWEIQRIHQSMEEDGQEE